MELRFVEFVREVPRSYSCHSTCPTGRNSINIQSFVNRKKWFTTPARNGHRGPGSQHVGLVSRGYLFVNWSQVFRLAMALFDEGARIPAPNPSHSIKKALTVVLWDSRLLCPLSRIGTRVQSVSVVEANISSASMMEAFDDCPGCFPTATRRLKNSARCGFDLDSRGYNSAAHWPFSTV